MGKLEEKRPLERLWLDGSIILRWIFRKWDWEGGMYWIALARDWCRWWAFVNMVMNLHVP